MSQPAAQLKPLIPRKPSIFSILGPYKGMIIFLVVFALLSNGINLLIPKIIARSIDDFNKGHLDVSYMLREFCIASILIFIFTYLQSIVQTYASERVASDLRLKLSARISAQSYSAVERADPSKLLTNLTSDADSVKLFVSQAIASIASSIFIIIGASILLLNINWKLALTVIAIIPLIGGSFFYVLSKVRVLFKKSREVIDWLNKVINESIMGSALIKVLNSQQLEYGKFLDANKEARNLGLSILRMFASLIPVIIFISNMATLSILLLGGHFVISGSMSLGNFAAFYSYLALLIFPILVIGFMSNVIAQASASYQRIYAVLELPEESDLGLLEPALIGQLAFNNVSLLYGQKSALKNISFEVKAGSRTAIIGPTAAGKTTLLYLLTALIKPDSGTVQIDNHDLSQYKKQSLHQQLGFVFQDSIIFNLSLRENIAFSNKVSDASLQKAIQTAELSEFIESLPLKLDTIVSERGTSLSGGQKQRIMLARALAINPQILLLDDFTARVDGQTEKKILSNVRVNYPGITLVSVTQKISAIEDYEQIILLMEAEIIARGTHQQLMHESTEYVQIYNSQKSTSNYELQS